jgi:hypothetical protein
MAYAKLWILLSKLGVGVQSVMESLLQPLCVIAELRSWWDKE